MSVIVFIFESFHHEVDQLISVFVSFVGQMQIDHGSFQALVSKVFLDGAQIDAGFEEMCGIGVALMPNSA